MLKAKLADELRQRQYKIGRVSRELIDTLTDDQIIDSYITCSCCGEKQVDEAQLQQIIKKASSADEILAVCDLVAKANKTAN